jgi:murein DD-endopeptidase MepM/ murein hydrolase activator NlpD
LHRIAAFAIVSLIGAASLTGCGVVGGSSATKTPTSTSTSTLTPTQTPTPTFTPTATPTATPTPLPAHAFTSSDSVGQGETIVVRVEPAGGAASASAAFRGHTYPMLEDSDGAWAVIGAADDGATGTDTVMVSLFDGDGAITQTIPLAVSVVSTNYPNEDLTVPDEGQPNGLQPPEAVAAEDAIRAEVFSHFTPEKLWSGPFILPAAGPFTTAFGTTRSYNGGPASTHHSGTDIGADEGDSVVAAADGRVAFTGMLATRGNSIIIDHGAGVFTGYHHLSRIDVNMGDTVTQGEQIGLVGMTGLATGPHLHWELIIGGVNVDPVAWTMPGVAP